MKIFKTIPQNAKQLNEIIVVLILLFYPLLHYVYLIFPSKPSIELMGINIVSHWYEDVETMFWIILIKANLVFLLSIWFFFNKEWWRFSVLVILSFTIFQLFSSVNEELALSPTFKQYYSIFFFLIFIPIYIALDKWINYEPVSFGDKIESLTSETISKLIELDRNTYSMLQNQFEELRQNKALFTQKEYLYKLMAIQSAIDNSINGIDESSS